MKVPLIKMMLCLLLLCSSAEAAPVNAAPPILGLIKEAVKKVIKAMDLKIQKLQNKTIKLQNAQKQIENTLSKLKLEEISDWAKKQKDLYSQYYNELKEVKSVVSQYQRIRDITAKQAKLLSGYQRTWNLLRQGSHFTDDELDHMQQVYQGILEESMATMEHIFTIIESYAMSMNDAERLQLINAAADRVDANYDDLQKFNRENIILYIQRQKAQNEVNHSKNLYGIGN
ncbi:conjugal transfer protein TraI [Flavobacterium sp. RHBU_24]|uniref:conjugal transfer protein TraI n=1 Tax=Flavobacterium sp. RHBU_24 TaxID=3391185 RepID=UPI0039848203